MEIKHNESLNQFELFDQENKIGYLTYILNSPSINLNYVYVNSNYRGQGLALKLVDEAIAYVESNDLKPIFTCPVIHGLVERKYPKYL